MTDLPHAVGASVAEIDRAAAILRAGGLVAFPTETVYGLGARADDEAAVARIYAAKGRPSTNPLIVHVASLEGARALASRVSPTAERLARALWPGPLTLVLEARASATAPAVRAGGATVAVRSPAHPVARALLERLALPVAAPSANRSNHVSPTTADHVARSLGARVDLVLDGGACTVGLESTIVDVSRGGARPRVLRLGGLSLDALRELAPDLDVPARVLVEESARAEAPGSFARHYAPVFAIEFVDPGTSAARARDVARERAIARAALRVAVVLRDPNARNAAGPDGTDVRVLGLPADPAGYARALYATLHELEAAGHDLVLIERAPDTEAWGAVRDRLRRAAEP